MSSSTAWITPAAVNSNLRSSTSTTRRQRPSACAHNIGMQAQPPQHPSSKPTSRAATPLLDALAAESPRIRANFCCPGHKQGAKVLPQWRNLVGESALAVDLPELPALDNLFAPEGVIEESQQLAADTFTREGSEEWNTFFLVNGTTCGVEAAILASVRPGAKVILPRNTHQSAVHALVLSGAVPVWIEPVYDAKYDLLHGVTAVQIADKFDEHHGDIDAVLIISPTYHGICSDVEAIARIAHDYNAVLIVDEAHGAHFSFHDLLPKSATYTQADIVIQSTHRTLTAFSQAAMLHARESAVSKQKMASALQLVQSTSPNYLLLASLEATRALMDQSGEDLMSQTIDLARNCAVRIASLDGFSVLGVDQVGTAPSAGMYEIDPTRITVLLPGGVTGYDLDTHLIDRFGVYAELPSFKHVTFVMTPGNTREDVDRLVTALALYEATSHEGMPDMASYENELPASCGVFGEETVITPRAAFFAQAESIPAEQAINRICVETLCPYPPGIPVLVAGERVTEECVQVLRAVLDAGGSVSGASDDTLSTIRVMKVEEEQHILNKR